MSNRLLAALFLLACASAFGHERHSQPAAGSSPAALDAPAVQAPRAPRGELEVFMSHLKQPEYLHVVVNPLPIYAMALGAVLLLAGLLRPIQGVREAGLALIVLAGASTLPTVLLGQRAYDRLYMQVDLEAQRWLDVHMSRAERLQWLFYATAGTGALALLATRRGRPAAGRLAQAALAGSAVCAAAAGWIAHAGGQVRHPEFRLGPPAHDAESMKERHRPSETPN